MNIDWMRGVFAGTVAVALACVAYGQQSTPPPATDYAPASPGATSASPTTDAAAPAAGVTSGAGALESDGRANEQSAETAAAETAPAETAPTTTPGVFPAPTNRPASPLDRQLGSDAGGGGTAAGQGGGQRGELGVWLVETGGAGVQVRRITEGSAADMAGLEAGDVILSINGRGANSPHAVAQMIRQLPAGQAANVQYWRDGQTSELEIVLQPVREQHEVAFRGDNSMGGMGRPSGDLESRTMRLEQQLAMVMQELRQLRQEMAQSRGGGSSSTIGGGGVGEATTATGFDAATETGTTTQPAATSAATELAEQPEAAPAATPAPTTESATGDDNVFDAGATEEPAATATDPDAAEAAPAEDEAAPDAAPAEGASDDLFE